MKIKPCDSPLPGAIADTPPVRLASAFFTKAVAFRSRLYDRFPSLSWKAPRTVISVGGIRAGGTGKTPVALLTGKYLAQKGRNVAFLSRGYRRKDRTTRIIAPHEPVDWKLVGDEPWLLHHSLPESWLGIDSHRRAAAMSLAPLLPENAVFVLDDGFQHRALHREMDIVCLHCATFEERMLPAGFLREPVSSLSRASAAMLIGSSGQEGLLEPLREKLAARFPSLPLFILFQEHGVWINAGTGEETLRPPHDHPVVLAGIARPDRFLSMVEADGIIPSAVYLFSDHHRYLRNDFNKTRELYSNGIITTEKDAVRLRNSGIVPDEKIWYLTIRLRFETATEEENFHQLIDLHLSYF